MTPSLVALLGYVVVQLAIGFWVSRTVHSEQDYLLGGRSFGPLLTTMSVFATWFGAETCVGAAGEVYRDGPGAVSSDPYGYGLCLLLMGLFIAAPLWRRGLVTLADLFKQRYSPVVERTVAVLMIPSSLLWAAAQIRGFGGVVSSASGFEHEAGMMIGIAVVIVYTTLGGLRADAITDLVQGTVLIGTLVVLGVVAAVDVGAIGRSFGDASAAAVAAAEAEVAPSLLATLDAWAVPVLGSLFAQELVSRASAARSPSLARNSTVAAAGIYMLVGSIPVALGLVAREVEPGVEASDQVLPTLARHYLGELGLVIFGGALISAILSTVDSALLACGSLLSHNLLPARLREGAPHVALRVARFSVVGLALVAYGLAHTSDSVHDLVTEASAFGSAGVFVTAVFGLMTTRFGGALSALGALVAGVGSWIYFGHVEEADGAYLFSVAACASTYVGVALLERAPAVAPSSPG
jgi:Na+/proline symporter